MEKYVILMNEIVVHACQVLAIVVISIGISKSVIRYIKDAVFGADSAVAIQKSRLELGHSFSLGLGFLIGASILKTTIAPNWTEIGQLASIIGIRTVLTQILLREVAGVGKGKSKEEKGE
jgi:uncharacterized membrane protein